jgi:hypothetical protein
MFRLAYLLMAGASAAVLLPTQTYPPATTRTVTLADYRFIDLPSANEALAPAVERWIVLNTGRQLHQLEMRRLADSTALPAALAWLDAGTPTLGAPGLDVPVSDVLLRGERTSRQVLLQPGLYLVYCLVPTGRRTADHEIEQHVMVGMRSTFVVAEPSRRTPNVRR